jgi:uncharacterized protein YbjQ (UPF0145 family)
MRILYLLLFIYTGLFLSACSMMDTQDSASTTQNISSKTALIHTKDPLTVAVYTQKHCIRTPYTILGKAVISQYNPGGIKRQEACIHDSMRSLAAAMGGDAIINLNKNDKTVTGTVIAYQNEKNPLIPSMRL